MSNLTGVTVRYLGGPTAVIDIGGVRLLTDPTFDAAGDYPIGSRVLTKTADAVATAEEIGSVDAVLLSHDQHPDNLDTGGRNYVASAPLTLSTPDAQSRLGGTVRGLSPWDVAKVGELTVTAVPAQHGPDGSEPVVGQVTGFVLEGPRLPLVYFSGDNASLDVVRTIAERFGAFDIVLLNAGAARTALFDGALLTLSSEQAAQAAIALNAGQIVPLHFEDWAHFGQGRDTLSDAFDRAGLSDRLHLLARGETWTSGVSHSET